MDYNALLRRAWNIVWNNKWLFLLGIIVVLGGAGGNNSSGSGYSFNQGDFFQGSQERRDFDWFDEAQPPEFVPPDFDFQRDFQGMLPGMPMLAGLSLAILIPLICLGVGIAAVLWALGTIARGGLVNGVDTLDGGGLSSFGEAWRAGWEKGWRLIGIGLLPAVPTLVLLVAGAGLGGAFFGISRIVDTRALVPAGIGLSATLIGVLCIAGLAALVLSLLRTFAERACMLEDAGVFASYSRGWEVLRANLGPAIAVYLLQLVIGLAVGIVMLALSPILCLLCLLIIPISLVVNGAVVTYFSALWTLAWREWTGRVSGGEPVVEASPAV